MADNTNIKLTVDAWADIVIKEWLKKADALNIHKGAALNSFINTMYTAADGDPGRIVFAFEWYLKMVDYGVGKYVTLEDRDGMITGNMTKRRPKPWFTDTFYKQLEVLRHLLEEKHAIRMEQFIVRNLTDNSDYGNQGVTYE